MNVRCIQLLAHEVSLLNELSHENIVKVIGFVEDAKDGIAWMILPWEKNGNLREFIASAEWEFPERLALVCRFPAILCISPSLTTLQIHDVANGVDYLHSRESPICHGDLKSVSLSGVGII